MVKKHMHFFIIMQILSDYDYILSKLKCKLHVTVVLSRGYTSMITSNFTLLKIIVHTNHVC